MKNQYYFDEAITQPTKHVYSHETLMQTSILYLYMESKHITYETYKAILTQNSCKPNIKLMEHAFYLHVTLTNNIYGTSMLYIFIDLLNTKLMKHALIFYFSHVTLTHNL